MSTYTAHTLVIPSEGDLEYAVSSIVDGMHVGMPAEYSSIPLDTIVTEEEAIRLLESLIAVLKLRAG